MTTYQPHPVDTSHIILPKALQPLAERIAANVHEVWAQQRIAEGWTCGAVRNDALMQHPCLVPYDQLPESEKEYDRNTAQETLRLIVALGFSIVPPAGSGATL